MANQTDGNPYVLDTVGTIWEDEGKLIMLIQWIDDAGDITHDSAVAMTVNDANLVGTIQPVANQLGFGAVAWQIGPFSPYMPIHKFKLDSLSHGKVHIWFRQT